MESVYRTIAIEWTAVYLTMVAILSFLILYDLWMRRDVLRHRVCVLLYLSVASFLFGRVLVLASVGAARGEHFFPQSVWGILNLASFLFAAEALRRFFERDSNGNHTSSTAPAKPYISRKGLKDLKQTGYFFIAGGLVYFLVMQAGGMAVSATKIINVALFTAAMRPIAFLFLKIRLSDFYRMMWFYISISLVTVSWLAMFSALISSYNAQLFIQAAMFTDVLMLISLIMFLISHNMQIRLYYKDKSDCSQREMENAKEELAKLRIIASEVYKDNSDLVKRQKAQTFSLSKRIENLENILQIGMTIQKQKDLDDLLQMIVELVRENLGFNTVILRLLNDKTQSFETKAHVGLNDEVRDTVLSYRIPLPEYEKMIKSKHRLGNSYFLRRNEENSDSNTGGESILVDDAWGGIDLFIVPLPGDGNHTIGYLSVENPENASGSVADVIENLEMIASLTVIAIRNAHFFTELETKNEKLKLYAAKLSGLNKMKSNFVAMISHEFRTPLTSIKSYCETLLRSPDDVDRKILKEFLLVIDEESNRLMALIEDILDFSYMETGAIKLEKAPCNLNKTIQDVAMELEKNFEQKNIKLHKELPQSKVMVRAEKELMKRLLINLLHNASKFTPDGGNVWVRLQDENVSARIIVEDDGIGIPEDQLDRIFDQFHQVDASIRRKYGGSGLGLSICKTIVDWHDGRIWIEKYKGHGTRFAIVLPKKQVVVNSQVLNLGETVQKLEAERYMELLVEVIAELLGASRVSIMLFDENEEELRVESAIGLDEDVVEKAKVKPGDGIAGLVFQEGESYLVENIEEDPRIKRKNNDFLYGTKSFLSVPVWYDDRIIGVVNVSNHADKRVFDEGNRLLLELFAERIGIALGKFKKYARSTADFNNIRNTIKAILDVKRYFNVQNSDVIVRIAMKVAKKLGLDEKEKAALSYVLNVYDLGLSKVGHHVIEKPFELSPEDREAIEKHTMHGTEMLKSFERLPKIFDIVRHHHENFDGTGYPDKLTGSTIPIEARIIRVADSLRALISHRPYQRKYTLEEAKEVLKHRSGSFFDPKVVDAFFETMDEDAQLFVDESSSLRSEPEKERV